MAPKHPEALLRAALAGDAVALGRVLSLVERGGEPSRIIDRVAFARSGRAHTVGITGAPGAGKSTLTERLIAEARAAGQRIAVLAVDPSSPYSGGAILGDRVRMERHALDAGVFIRSMASRGHLGGLALAARAAARLLDAAGYDWVIVETVGVGQVEVDVAGATDTTVVVVNPGWGDAVQANKAGLLEIADVLVVNKADRAGAAQTAADLASMQDLTGRSAAAGPSAPAGAGADGSTAWLPPILAAIATAPEDTGPASVWEAIAAHRAHLARTGELSARRDRRLAEEVAGLVAEHFRLLAAEQLRSPEIADAIAGHRIDPRTAADAIAATIASQAAAGPV